MRHILSELTGMDMDASEDSLGYLLRLMFGTRPCKR